MTQLMESAAGQFDRLPPSSIEAEMCLLASMMLDRDIVGQVVQIVRPESFFQADHGIIYDLIEKLWMQNRPIDALIVREELIKRGLYEEVGGKEYLAALLNTVPSAAHGVHYATIVREKALLRQLISASNEILRDAYAPHEHAEHVLNDAEKRIFAIAEQRVGNAITPMEQVLHQVWEQVTSKNQSGLETGYFELDEMTNGLQNGEMIIIAARPSMGKAQPLDARVLTPRGWTTMGELRVGDELASVDGKRSRVKDIFPQGQKQVYRVTFADGRSTECCAEHLWKVDYRGWDEPRVVDTQKLITMLGRKRYRNRLFVETFSGEFGADADLPLDPWLLGLLIGDGCLCGGSLRFSTAEPAILAQVRESVGAKMAVIYAGGYDYRISQAGGAHGSVTVPAVTIDDLAAEHGTPDVLYIDVEGYEIEALRGAGRTLATEPDVFVEVHAGCGLERYGATVQQVAAYFPTERYDLQMLVEGGKPLPFDANHPIARERFYLVARKVAAQSRQ